MFKAKRSPVAISFRKKNRTLWSLNFVRSWKISEPTRATSGPVAGRGGLQQVLKMSPGAPAKFALGTSCTEHRCRGVVDIMLKFADRVLRHTHCNSSFGCRCRTHGPGCGDQINPIRSRDLGLHSGDETARAVFRPDIRAGRCQRLLRRSPIARFSYWPSNTIQLSKRLNNTTQQVVERDKGWAQTNYL